MQTANFKRRQCSDRWRTHFSHPQKAVQFVWQRCCTQLQLLHTGPVSYLSRIHARRTTAMQALAVVALGRSADAVLELMARGAVEVCLTLTHTLSSVSSMASD